MFGVDLTLLASLPLTEIGVVVAVGLAAGGIVSGLVWYIDRE